MTSNFPGRNGRRRRVLNEEFLSASSSHLALRAAHDEEQAAYDAPRYSEAAGVEHHPQVTDFIPRRYRSIAALGLAGVTMLAVLVALSEFAEPVASALGMVDTRAFTLGSGGSIADWAAAVVLMIASTVCLLIYSIRRHRIDDIRGSYRVWLIAAVACLLLSVDSVAGLHTVLASGLTHVSGWSALRDGSAWWLATACIPMAWIALRVLLDARECRLATALLMTGIGCYGVALANYLDGLPVAGLQTSSSVTAGAQLVGHWVLLIGAVAYARYVILDAQGLIAAPRRTTTRANRASSNANATLQIVDIDRSTDHVSSKRKSSSRAAEDTDWIDGSRPERDDYRDEDDADRDRKVSKTDRKRMRKFKAQNRAA